MNLPCPECKSNKDVVEIVYGLPDAKVEELSQNGKVMLGGCTIAPQSPQYHCKKCKNNFGTVDWTDDYWEFLVNS